MRRLKSQLRRNMAGERGTEREEYAGEWYTACREALNADLAQWDGRHSKRPQLEAVEGWIVDTFGGEWSRLKALRVAETQLLATTTRL